MRLINVGVGEITDRLTILSLKLLFGKAAGKPTDHFLKEQQSLLAKIRSRELNAVWFEQVLELAAVNAALWHAEDDLRAERQKSDASPKTGQGRPAWDAIFTGGVTILAFRIQELNDRRSMLIDLINVNSGEKAEGEEKI